MKKEKIGFAILIICSIAILISVIIGFIKFYQYQERKEYYEPDENWFEEDLEQKVKSRLVDVIDIYYEDKVAYVEFEVIGRQGKYMAEYHYEWQQVEFLLGYWKWEFKDYIYYLEVIEE